MKKYCVGVDVGGTSVKLGLFETEGTLLKNWEVPTRKANGGESILGDIADSIKGELATQQLTIADLVGVGMGVPGPVTPEGYVSVCVNLGWKDCYPAVSLSEMLEGCHVCVSNDANIAALGEQWAGGAKGFKNVVLLTLGTGVGGGVIIDGKIVNGVHGAGGELGHVIVNPNEKDRCNCGSYGCLEQYASATGVVRVAKRLLAANTTPSSLREIEQLSAKDIFDAAKQGDAVAKEGVQILSQYLGLATANCALTIDPEIFVIGGGVSRAGEILTNGISKYFDQYTPIIKEKARFSLATLGNDAGIYGAASLVL